MKGSDGVPSPYACACSGPTPHISGAIIGPLDILREQARNDSYIHGRIGIELVIHPGVGFLSIGQSTSFMSMATYTVKHAMNIMNYITSFHRQGQPEGVSKCSLEGQGYNSLSFGQARNKISLGRACHTGLAP